jgi:hypothetical protein
VHLVHAANSFLYTENSYAVNWMQHCTSHACTDLVFIFETGTDLQTCTTFTKVTAAVSTETKALGKL